jgi:MOSC domain-containing protein YiiM
MTAPGSVEAVSASPAHTMSKTPVPVIRLLAGVGVEGDAHSGATVRHRSHVERDPTQPNLRQVHLLHGELHDELRAAGFDVAAGRLGENITTRGVPLLDLPAGTRLHLGAEAVVTVRGLRDPCHQLDDIHVGLMQAVLERGAGGQVVRTAGVMGTVAVSGEVRPGDSVTVELPPPPYRRLRPV